MRTILWILIGFFTLCCGCANNAELAGRWRGFVVAEGKPTLVELNLRAVNNRIEGTFVIINETRDSRSIVGSYEIVSVSRSGNKLNFTVPITGKVDDNAIAFELELDKGDLIGQGHELRKDSQPLSAAFRRRE